MLQRKTKMIKYHGNVYSSIVPDIEINMWDYSFVLLNINQAMES